MQRVHARLLRHQGHGPEHLDLVFEDGPRCPTMHLHQRHGCWSAYWGIPHRRRYLTYSGPLGAGRGRVTGVWQGAAYRWRLSGGCFVRLGTMTSIVMRGTHLRITKGTLPRSPRG